MCRFLPFGLVHGRPPRQSTAPRTHSSYLTDRSDSSASRPCCWECCFPQLALLLKFFFLHACGCRAGFRCSELSPLRRRFSRAPLASASHVHILAHVSSSRTKKKRLAVAARLVMLWHPSGLGRVTSSSRSWSTLVWVSTRRCDRASCTRTLKESGRLGSACLGFRAPVPPKLCRLERPRPSALA